jgi:hypothetical protein
MERDFHIIDYGGSTPVPSHLQRKDSLLIYAKGANQEILRLRKINLQQAEQLAFFTRQNNELENLLQRPIESAGSPSLQTGRTCPCQPNSAFKYLCFIYFYDYLLEYSSKLPLYLFVATYDFCIVSH